MFATSATADTSSSTDIVNPKIYGNCRVHTEVDMLTDKVSHVLECRGETHTDVTSAVIIFSEEYELLMTKLNKGVMFHFDDEIPVAFRIDKGELRRGHWRSPFAVTLDEEIGMALLNELPTGRRIAIQVGEESGNVILDGSAAAVKDFLARPGR
jgi:hypothetical protein